MIKHWESTFNKPLTCPKDEIHLRTIFWEYFRKGRKMKQIALTMMICLGLLGLNACTEETTPPLGPEMFEKKTNNNLEILTPLPSEVTLSPGAIESDYIEILVRLDSISGMDGLGRGYACFYAKGVEGQLSAAFCDYEDPFALPGDPEGTNFGNFSVMEEISEGVYSCLLPTNGGINNRDPQRIQIYIVMWDFFGNLYWHLGDYLEVASPDLNGDLIVELSDISLFSGYLADFTNHGIYEFRADLNHDGSIDISDISLFNGWLGDSCQE